MVLVFCVTLLKIDQTNLFQALARSVRTIEKASGRRAGSAASGIRERKGEGGSS